MGGWQHRLWDSVRASPTFPLNTDGIDPAGRDIHIYNISVTNFDDAVAVKPTCTPSPSPFPFPLSISLITKSLVRTSLRVRWCA
eukprot:113185-Pyramimonas_sp.AAC.2